MVLRLMRTQVLINDYGHFPQHLEKLFFNEEEIIYHGIKCSFLIKEATTESFYLFVQSNQCYRCKKTPQQLFQRYFQNKLPSAVSLPLRPNMEEP